MSPDTFALRSLDWCLRSSPMVLKRHRAGLERTRSIYLIRRSKGLNAPPLDGVWRHLASRGQPPAVSSACFDGACLLHQVCAALPNPAAGHGSQLRAPGSRPGLLPHPGSNCRPWLTRGLAALGLFSGLLPCPPPCSSFAGEGGVLAGRS